MSGAVLDGANLRSASLSDSSAITTASSTSRVSCPARGTAAASIGSRAMEHVRLAWQSTLKPVLESVGVKNILSKSLGSNNHLAMVNATMAALLQLRSHEEIQNIRFGEAVAEV